MNNKISWQQFKVLFFVHSFLALFSIITGMASAAEAATIDIKDTNYPIPSGAYFVSSSGKDTNSGKAPDSPWPVGKAISSAPEGATIVFRGGTYRNVGNINIRKQLTLQAYPREKAWLKGSVQVTGWVADGDIWRKDGWTNSFPSDVGSLFIDSDYPLAGYRDMVYINGESLKQVARKSNVKAGTFYVDPAQDRLYIGRNPAGKIVEATTHENAFSMWKGSYDPSGTVVRGLGFAHYADRAISIGAARVKLEDNTFAWNGVDGVRLWGRSGGKLGVSVDNIVRGNTFSYNGRKGLGGAMAHRLLLEDNTFSHNNVERFQTNWDAAGVKIVETDDLVLRDNLVEHNYSIGAWVDISSTDSTIVNNISRHNDRMGIFFELSHRAIIAANVVHNNGVAGIMVSNSSSALVYNNTLANNSMNLRLKDTSRNNTNTKEIDKGVTWIARDNVFRNNILSNTMGGPFFDSSNCDTKEAATETVTSSDYNAYYRKSSNEPRDLIKWSLGLRDCDAKYTSISAFKSATKFEDHALVIEDVSNNPFFVNEADGNYKLKAGSPAIGYGSPLPDNVARAIGLPSRVPVDLGAIQSKIFLVDLGRNKATIEK